MGNDKDAKAVKPKHTCESLRLNLADAAAGRTWLLLPEGFRSADNGKTYPLPTSRTELQRLVAITIPPHKRDCGVFYIMRAIVALRARNAKYQSAIIDIGRRAETLNNMSKEHSRNLKILREQAKQAVTEVQKQAEAAIASLNDLFSLGRKGIEGQMRAHIEGTEWMGEKISARDFREAFRMVAQSVKALGVPSDQRDPAREAILEEVAAALKDTQDAVSMAPAGDKETEH